MAIVLDTTSIPGTTIVYDDTNGGVTINYTPLYERIATSLETISTDIAIIKDNLGSAAAIDTTIIEEKLDSIAVSNTQIGEQLLRLRELSDKEVDGSGIMTNTPYGYIANAILYQLYVKQAQILSDPSADAAKQLESLNTLKQIVEEIVTNLEV
jgi:hypothetical protein